MQIIENFYDPYAWNKIEEAFLKNRANPWGHQVGVAHGDHEDDDLYFVSLLYDNFTAMGHNSWIIPELCAKLKVNSLKRVKVNLYPRTENLIHHKDHVDYDFPHKGALLSLNTCNGMTVIGDQEIPSVANRMILFDPQVPHHSTNCTDEPFRANININYF